MTLNRSMIVRVAPGEDPRAAARWAAERILGQPAEGHPDFEVFESDGNVFRVPIVEELVFRSVLAPVAGAVRVFAVIEPERMTDEAANLLLKTLEEPPPSLHLLFVTSRPFDLSPTVRSRCGVVEAPVGDRSEGLRIAGLGEAETRRLSFLSGSTREAGRLAEEHERRDLIEAWIELAASVHELPMSALVLPDPIERLLSAGSGGDDESRRRARRERTDDLVAGLQILACLYREVAARALGAELSDPPVEEDPSAPVVTALARDLGPVRALAAIDDIAVARESILANGTARLALEVLLLRLGRHRPPPALDPAEQLTP